MYILLLTLLANPIDIALSADHGTIIANIAEGTIEVRVGTGTPQEIAARSTIPGTTRLKNDKLIFTPRFPLSPGVPYQVRVGETNTTLIVPMPKPTATVTAVYPTEDKLPENLLRFYIHFSKPMSKGEAYEHIHLLDGQGNKVKYPFLELAEELWSDDHRRFTLLLDPGRVKRHLAPREEAGPVLEAGHKYTLVIDKSWQDRDGVAMKQTFRKTFTATTAQMEPIDPKKWTLILPYDGKPFQVQFNQSIDHALASRMIWVIDSTGKKQTGRIAEKQSLLWRLDSTLPPGTHQLLIDTRLEDPSGNRIGQAFEVDLLEPIPERVTVKTVSIPFTIAK